ncbi:MAG: hypothetical protein Ta2A_03480 [Treponemataceae bacterium]|nr:MAG: hypothetical protein Ta2A_03480 [Treponemataceae bacterium]
MAKKYIAFIELEKELAEDTLGVVFPDFPGCISCGDNYDEAVRMAHEALSGHIAAMREDGETVPEPRTFEQIATDWDDFADWKDSHYAVEHIVLRRQRTAISPHESFLHRWQFSPAPSHR